MAETIRQTKLRGLDAIRLLSCIWIQSSHYKQEISLYKLMEACMILDEKVVWKARIMNTYVVPAILVLIWVISSGKSLANPKSPIFGWKSLSRSMLLALISLCTICGTSSSWRKARAFAVPEHIADLLSQFSRLRSLV